MNGPARPRAVDRVLDAGPSAATSQVDRRRDVLPHGDFTRTDPFLMMSEDWFSHVGFDWHPHRGFETVTYVVDGELEHQDNAGGKGVLGPGDLQWVTTGRGVMHAELAKGRRPVHTLQLWLNLPAAHKMTEPGYQDLRGDQVPAIRSDGAVVRVFAGSVGGVRGPARTLLPAGVIDARLEDGARFVHEIPGDHAAFLYVLAGEVQAGGQRLTAGQVAWLDPGAAGPTGLELVAKGNAHLVAYSGQPIREPVFAYGPFVMNRREEILEAIRDYQNGEFGPTP